MRNLIVGLIKQPVVHFLVLGAILGLGLHWWADDRAQQDEKQIRISATDVARLDAGWRSRYNRVPTPQELDGLVNALVREQVLYREAVAMGLDRDEPVIRRVLGQKLESIAKDLIELSLAPTDQDLAQYYAEHAERYRPPSLITFTHVFVDPDARGDQAIDDAKEIVAQLQALGQEVDDIDEYGDRFMLQSYYPEKDRQRIASLFGGGFADPLFELTPGEWHGPVLSGYGLHAVYVHELRDFPVPDLEDVTEKVRQQWVDDKRREITDRYFADLIARYDVVIEGQASDEPVEVAAAQVP